MKNVSFSHFRWYLIASPLAVLLFVAGWPRGNGPTSLSPPVVCESASEEALFITPAQEGIPYDFSRLDAASRELFRMGRAAPFAAKKQLQEKEEFVTLARARKALFLEALEQDPRAALLAVLSPRERKHLKTLTRNCIELPITVEGVLEVWHADFDQGSRDVYVLVTSDNERVVLHPVSSSTALLQSGVRLRVSGYQLDHHLLFDASSHESVRVVDETPFFLFGGRIGRNVRAAVNDAQGIQPTVVLLVNFQNTTQPDLSKETVQDMIFNQMNAYYREASYDKTSVSGDILGWYTIPIDQTCDTIKVYNEAIAISDPDVFFPNYSRLIIVAPFGNLGDSYCWWSGLATIGKISVTTVDGGVSMSVASIRAASTSMGLVGHEFGHNLGVHHAGFLNCGDATIAKSGCTENAYGDLYDIMGAWAFKGHMNTPHKDYIGWFNAGNLLTVSESGTYVLEPFETISSGLKALKIPRSTDYLFVEYRQPIGFDANSNLFLQTDVYQGALLHTLKTAIYSLLLDASPPADSKTPALLVGASFKDPETATTMTVTDRTDAALTVEVVLGKTDFSLPSVVITAPQNYTTVSGTVEITAEAFDAESGVLKVEFYNASPNKTVLLGTDFEAPYSALWDTTHFPNGTSSLYAMAYDKSGDPFGIANNSAPSPTRFVLVENEDPEPPSVVFTEPLHGALVSNPVVVSADATDNVGIYRVEFWKDNDSYFLASDFESPYTLSIDLDDGAHTLWAVAVDFVGNKTASEKVVVNDTAPPSVFLTNPLDGAVVSGVVTLEASAADDIGIAKVQFLVDDVLLATDDTSPYNASWDTTNSIHNSSHTISAKAYDTVGNVSPASIIVTVVDITPPTVAITYPKDGGTVRHNRTETITADAADVSNIARVEFFVDEKLLCTDTTMPYSCDWNVPARPWITYTIVAKASDVAGNHATHTINVSSTW